jgi:hypothetical protein
MTRVRRVEERLAFCAGQRVHDALNKPFGIHTAVIGRAENL